MFIITKYTVFFGMDEITPLIKLFYVIQVTQLDYPDFLMVLSGQGIFNTNTIFIMIA